MTELVRQFHQDAICQSTGVIWQRKAFIELGQWDERLQLWQDIDLYLRAYILNYRYKKFFDLPPDLHNRVSSNSLSRGNFFDTKKQESRIIVIKKAVELLNDFQLNDLKREAKYMLTEIISGFIRTGYFAKANELMRWGLYPEGVFDNTESSILRWYKNAYKFKLVKFSFIGEKTGSVFNTPPNIQYIGKITFQRRNENKSNMKRAIILIIDSLGIGAMKDAPLYGDSLECNTLAHIAAYNNGLKIPNLQNMGLANIFPLKNISPVDMPVASFGKMMESSKGKDSTTGHWEIAGLVSEQGFATYPNGFPAELMDKFVEYTGCKGYLGNIPASGTAIIDQFHEEHKSTGYPIIYTSADSVFQIACDINIVPVEKLYDWCEKARELLDQGYNCSRVIARPYEESKNGPSRLGSLRKVLCCPSPSGVCFK